MVEQWETELVAEVQAILPAGTRFVANARGGDWIVDIVRDDGSVAWAHFGNGPDEIFALAVAWRRYVVEQLGMNVADRIYENGENEQLRRFFGPTRRS